MNRKKVLVGMSGGVDSSVAAAMLIEQGYEVFGVFVEAYNEPGCRTDQDKKDALQVALKLGIPFTVLDVRNEYKDKVVNYFIDEYKNGRTPNPDIICNRDIKFGLLYEYMERGRYDYLATGHYARVSSWFLDDGSWKYLVKQPIDLSKDQTYFLWQVGQEKLGKILWPLGDVKKSWVREKASELGLPNADKPDSMGVCMIGELNVRDFLREKLGTNPGPVMWKGALVGSHEGLWFYTIGARGGWSLSPKSKITNSKQILKSNLDLANLPPLYVIRKDPTLNILEVGEREECYRDKIIVERLKLKVNEGEDLWVRIRNLGELVPVKRLEVKGEGAEIETAQAIFALAPGQSAVFYDERGCVVGGGIIAET